MAKTKAWSDARPPLAIRVGVTGTRAIPDSRLAALQEQTAFVLRAVRDESRQLAARPAVRAVYRADATEASNLELRVVSPLAAGADRLVAEQAIALGYRLHAPMPFDKSEYEKDFGGDVAVFEALARQGAILELDGGRGQDETASYEAVGRFVVRNVDVLIALWDGKPARGRGGTAEIVDYAVRSELPVWWIHVEDATARLVLNATQLRRPGLAAQGDAAAAALAQYLQRVIAPPIAPHPERKGALGHAAHAFCNLFGRHSSPLIVYLEENPSPARGPWRAYSGLLRALAPSPKSSSAAISMAPAVGPVERWWENLYRRADALSQIYGDRYRSSYVLITLLAFSAFAISFGFELGINSAFTVGSELVLLLGIAALVLFNHAYGWQERWITYRLLAELCRNQLVLSPLGRTLPGAEVQRSVAEAAADHEPTALPREAWVSWYFLAAQRGAPMPVGDAVASKMRVFHLARTLVAEQRDYHRVRRARTAQADRLLAGGGELSFLLVILAIAAQLLMLRAGAPVERVRALEVLIRLLSAASAALIALRAYADFALLARQSLRMYESLTEIEAELDALDLDEPLASQRLGTILHRLALLMMQEVRGWAQIFRLKTVEAG